MSTNDSTIILLGTSHLPREHSVGESLQIVVQLDVEKTTVIDVNCTPCPRLIENFLKQLMIGMHLVNDFEKLQGELESRLHHRAKKSVVAATRDLMTAYREYKNGSRGQTAGLPTPKGENLRGFVFQEHRNEGTKITTTYPDDYFNR